MMSQVRALFAELSYQLFAVLAQQVERFHGKEEVTGSIPVDGLNN